MLVKGNLLPRGLISQQRWKRKIQKKGRGQREAAIFTNLVCHFISQSEDKNKRYYGNFQSVCYFDCCDYAREWHPLSEMACIYAMINKAAGKSGEPQNQLGISLQRSVKQLQQIWGLVLASFYLGQSVPVIRLHQLCIRFLWLL